MPACESVHQTHERTFVIGYANVFSLWKFTTRRFRFRELTVFVVVVQSVSHVWLFATPWTAHARHSYPSPSPWSLLKLMSIELVMPSNYVIICHLLLLLLLIFPSIRFFSNESTLRIRWASIGDSASASVLPVNIQDWFSLGLTGWSPCSPRGAQESSPTSQFKSINSSVLSFLYSPTLTSIHDCWKNYSFDCVDLYWQNDVSAFEYAV